MDGQMSIDEWLNSTRSDSWWHDNVCKSCNSQCSDYGGYPTYEACGFLKWKMGKGHLCNVCFDECRGKCISEKSKYFGMSVADIPMNPHCDYFDACYGDRRDLDDRTH